MLARIWKGEVPLERSGEYLQRMRAVALPDYNSTPGNQGAYCLHRHHDDRVEFLMLTFWESHDSIRVFSGADVNVAKYYDFDAEMLLKMVPFCDHYDTYDD